MELYVVHREGVYTQGIFGIYDNKDLAIQEAQKFAKNEYDDYHTFSIQRFILNEDQEMTIRETHGNDCELIISKKDSRVFTETPEQYHKRLRFRR